MITGHISPIVGAIATNFLVPALDGGPTSFGAVLLTPISTNLNGYPGLDALSVKRTSKTFRLARS